MDLNGLTLASGTTTLMLYRIRRRKSLDNDRHKSLPEEWTSQLTQVILIRIFMFGSHG